jgi:hypothetical protein
LRSITAIPIVMLIAADTAAASEFADLRRAVAAVSEGARNHEPLAWTDLGRGYASPWSCPGITADEFEAAECKHDIAALKATFAEALKVDEILIRADVVAEVEDFDFDFGRFPIAFRQPANTLGWSVDAPPWCVEAIAGVRGLCIFTGGPPKERAITEEVYGAIKTHKRMSGELARVFTTPMSVADARAFRDGNKGRLPRRPTNAILTVAWSPASRSCKQASPRWDQVRMCWGARIVGVTLDSVDPTLAGLRPDLAAEPAPRP